MFPLPSFPKSPQQELFNEYRNDRVQIFKNCYFLVLWMKVASALCDLRLELFPCFTCFKTPSFTIISIIDGMFFELVLILSKKKLSEKLRESHSIDPVYCLIPFGLKYTTITMFIFKHLLVDF